MRKIIVDEGFLPTPDGEIYRTLEDVLIKNGRLDAFFPWRDVPGGGHCRYVICKGHRVPFDAVRRGRAVRRGLDRR